jgi:hypothetical protein
MFGYPLPIPGQVIAAKMLESVERINRAGELAACDSSFQPIHPNPQRDPGCGRDGDNLPVVPPGNYC